MGTDYYVVQYEMKENAPLIQPATEIKQFVWNGETYMSKPVARKNELEFRFFKVLEFGSVNLYAFGGSGLAPAPSAKSSSSWKPDINIGMGSGGGVGLGSGINIGGRPNSPAAMPQSRQAPQTYFIEKPGAVPLQEIPLHLQDRKQQQGIRRTLERMFNNDAELNTLIQSTARINIETLAEVVLNYNKRHARNY